MALSAHRPSEKAFSPMKYQHKNQFKKQSKSHAKIDQQIGTKHTRMGERVPFGGISCFILFVDFCCFFGHFLFLVDHLVDFLIFELITQKISTITFSQNANFAIFFFKFHQFRLFFLIFHIFFIKILFFYQNSHFVF